MWKESGWEEQVDNVEEEQEALVSCSDHRAQERVWTDSSHTGGVQEVGWGNRETVEEEGADCELGGSSFGAKMRSVVGTGSVADTEGVRGLECLCIVPEE